MSQSPLQVKLETTTVDTLTVPPSAPDMVAHPLHYTSSPARCHDCGATIECYWVTEHLPFSLGSAVKYIWRRLHKGSALEDLKKARQYITFEIEKLEREARQ